MKTRQAEERRRYNKENGRRSARSPVVEKAGHRQRAHQRKHGSSHHHLWEIGHRKRGQEQCVA